LEEALGERWFQGTFSEAQIMNRQIRFGTLLDEIGSIRGKQFIKDTVKEVEANPKAASADNTENVSIQYGIQLEEYICNASFGSTEVISEVHTTAQERKVLLENMERCFPPGRSREEILNRTMMFTSLAREYLRRITNVYFTAFPEKNG
jgi:hypothetical protein